MECLSRKPKATFATLAVLALLVAGSPPLFAANVATLTSPCRELLSTTSSCNQSALPLLVWHPTENPRAIAVLVHGITANAACLDPLARNLAADGVMTYGIDLRGHGSWLTSSVPSGRNCDFNASVRDLDGVVKQLRIQHPGLPVFLIGESVGAAVALRSAVDSPSAVDGIVLCAPGTKCARANPLWVLGDLMKACVGKTIDLTRYQNKYGSEDKIALQLLEHQRGTRSIFSARELLSTIRFIHKNKKVANHLDPQLPVLVMQGAEDRTIRPGSGKKLFASLPSRQKWFQSIPHCGHVLLATPRLKRAVSESIVGFINRQSSQSAIAAERNTYQ